MKHRITFIFSVVALISLMLSGAATAQPAPPDDDPFSRRVTSRGQAPRWDERLPPDALMLPGSRPREAGEATAGHLPSVMEASAAVTGAPGLTYSHVQTYGVNEDAFLADIQHFHFPAGVFAAGTTVWIADTDANRALKFNSSGAYQNLTIGKAGFREFYQDLGVSLDRILDIGVDSGGNVWLVDGGARHVAKFNSAGEYQFSIGDPWGGDFNKPWGIAFDSAGNVYISNRYNHSVEIYSNAGSYINTFGTYGNGTYQLNEPMHIEIFNNQLFVADQYNHRVQIFNVSNPLAITYVATLGTGTIGNANGQFRRPHGIAVNGAYIFVADAGNHRIQVFNNAPPYTYVAQFGDYGANHGEFAWPSDVSVDGSNNIYVADTWNHRIEQFNSSRVWTRTYGTTGVPYLTDQYHYNNPLGVALGADQSIYIAEGRGRRIVRLKPDGTPLWQVGENGNDGDDQTHFSWPEAIAVGPDGRVFVVDAYNHRVQVFNSNGGYLATIGSEGSGNGQFKYPLGIAVDRYNNVYVTDLHNCRIQKFNSSLQFVAKLGSCGTGTNQFGSPVDIAVDSAGRIYVVDQENHRVQLFDANLNYLRMIGLTGDRGSAYDRLSNPTAIAVDGQDRVIIADGWGSKIKVYDKDGKFLDCIDNGPGSFQGVFDQIEGIAADAAGNLYLADMLNHTVKKYIPGGYDGWRTVNVTGFGKHTNWAVWSMTVFDDRLFASTSTNRGYGAELYYLDQGNWVQAMGGGFSDDTNIAIDAFETFKGKIYAGTWNEGFSGTNGGQIWRTSTPEADSWEQVVSGGFGSTNNSEVVSLKAFGDYLYAGTFSDVPGIHGAEIYRSNTGDLGDWEKVFDDAVPGHDPAYGIMVMQVFKGKLYAGLYNSLISNAELWQTDDGLAWTQVTLNGFDDPNNYVIISLAEFDGWLYAGVGNYDLGLQKSQGAQVWRSDDGAAWEKVVDAGFGDVDNWGIGGLIVYRDQIYAITNQHHYLNPKETKGMEVWRSSTGNAGAWERVGRHAFGREYRDVYHMWHGNFVVHHDRLYIGTSSRSSSGGRVWTYTPDKIYMPIIRR